MAFAFLPFFPPCGEILQAIIVIFLLAGEKKNHTRFQQARIGEEQKQTFPLWSNRKG